MNMAINRHSILATALLVSAFGVSEVKASVIGDTMSLSYHYPDFVTAYGNFTSSPDPFIASVGPSVTGVLENVTTFTGSFSTTGTTDTLTFLINTVLSNPTLNTTTFNGPVLTVLNGANFGTVLSASGLVDTSRIIDTGSTVGINLSGITYKNGDTISVTFGVSAVPLPASAPMFGTALLAFGAAGFRFKRGKRAAAG